MSARTEAKHRKIAEAYFPEMIADYNRLLDGYTCYVCGGAMKFPTASVHYVSATERVWLYHNGCDRPERFAARLNGSEPGAYVAASKE